MDIRMIAIFSLGATVGYTVHRPATPAVAAVEAAREPRVAETVERPPLPRFIVVAPRAPSLPVPEPAPDPTPPAEAPEATEPAPDPDAPRGIIDGIVTDASTGERLSGVRVTADSLLGGASTYTDSDGHYRIENLASAVYKVHFHYYRRVNADRDVGVNQLDPTRLDVTLSQPADE